MEDNKDKVKPSENDGEASEGNSRQLRAEKGTQRPQGQEDSKVPSSPLPVEGEGKGEGAQRRQRRRRPPRRRPRREPHSDRRQRTRHKSDKTSSSAGQSRRPPREVQHPRNPPWTRDELILALDVYLRYNPSKISKHHPEIMNLSRTLRKLPLHRHKGDRKSFRSPASVYMQLRTFMSLDPRSRAAGLTHVNKLEQQIWREYSRDLSTLNKLAVALRSLSNSPLAKELNNPVAEEDDCPAGRLLFRLHKRLESNDKLVEMKRQRARALQCDLCGFDFEKTYGAIGKGYVEIHNRVPLTQMRANTRTRLSDLILVCSNCHRMLHRQRPHTDLRITKQTDRQGN